jgi:aryl-alcohol dehydrogenase-like predicted oxidoreductase
MMASEIGFGAWQLGNAEDWKAGVSDADRIALVHAAMDRGCSFFDTAPGYGRGSSEEILGQALKGRRHQVLLSTKVGHDDQGHSDFSPTGIRASLESSLQRLQTDYVDSLLLHNPPWEELSGERPLYATLDQLKSEGKIRAYGASVDSSREMFEVMRTTKSEVLEVLFNIFHQDTASAFPMAEAKHVAIIAKVPLDSGWLSGKYGRGSRFDDIRRRWPPEVIARRAALLEKIQFLKNTHESLTHAALRFILAHAAVTTVVPGIKSMQQLEENFSAASRSMPPAEVRWLEEFYETQISGDPLPW